jgi:hypothetical protein
MKPTCSMGTRKMVRIFEKSLGHLKAIINSIPANIIRLKKMRRIMSEI